MKHEENCAILPFHNSTVYVLRGGRILSGCMHTMLSIGKIISCLLYLLRKCMLSARCVVAHCTHFSLFTEWNATVDEVGDRRSEVEWERCVHVEWLISGIPAAKHTNIVSNSCPVNNCNGRREVAVQENNATTTTIYPCIHIHMYIQHTMPPMHVNCIQISAEKKH